MKNNTLTVVNDHRIASFLNNFYDHTERVFEIPSIGKVLHYTFTVDDALEKALCYCEQNPSDPEARHFFKQLLIDTADIMNRYDGGDLL